MRALILVALLFLVGCQSKKNEPLNKPNLNSKTVTQDSSVTDIDEIAGFYKNLNWPGYFFFIDTDRTYIGFSPSKGEFSAAVSPKYITKESTRFSYSEGELEFTGTTVGTVGYNETTYGKKLATSEIPQPLKQMVALLESTSRLNLKVRSAGLRVYHDGMVGFSTGRAGYAKVQGLVDRLLAEPSALIVFLVSKNLKGLRISAAHFPAEWTNLGTVYVSHESYLQVFDATPMTVDELYSGIKNLNLRLE